MIVCRQATQEQSQDCEGDGKDQRCYQGEKKIVCCGVVIILMSRKFAHHGVIFYVPMERMISLVAFSATHGSAVGFFEIRANRTWNTRKILMNSGPRSPPKHLKYTRFSLHILRLYVHH